MRGRFVFAVSLVDVAAHEGTAFGQHLESVPMRFFHGVENLVDIVGRNVLVEQVAHGVDEDHLRLADRKGLFQAAGPKRKIETRFERVIGHASEAFGKPFGIAVVAAGADLGAARYRVPRHVGPFDGGILRHVHPKKNISRTI